MLKIIAGGLSLLLLSQSQPTFKSGVDLVAVDVHVVDKAGEPILDLTPADFEVRVSGSRRRVVSADLITYRGFSTAEVTNPVRATEDSATAAPPRPRRLFVLAVDEHSLHVGNALSAVTAAERFIDQLQSDDLVGLHAYPTGVARHDLTTDHTSVRRALRKITGLYEEPSVKFGLSPSEAIDIANGDRTVTAAVVRRECAGAWACGPHIVQEATAFAITMEMKASQSVGALRALVRGLADIPDRKILVLVSGGLLTSDNIGGRANATMEIDALAREASVANLAVFALHLDWSFIAAQSSRGGIRTSLSRDSNMAATGLERIAGGAGGTVVRVLGTFPERAFDRVLRETSAHYLLGVEGNENDRGGRPKTIRVSVKRRGAQVRSRSVVVVPVRK